MEPRFKEKKAAQAAALLLQLRGGRMHYLKLLKLLYLVDREALLTWGSPVTYDRFVSMDRGPVLSKTKDLITDETEPGRESSWRELISEPEHYQVELVGGEFSCDALSDAEIALIRGVFRRYGRWNRWKLVRFTHALPEWQDPHGSALPIQYRDILAAGNKTEDEIAAIEGELALVAEMEGILP